VNTRADRLSPIAPRAWAPPPGWKPRRAARSRGSWPQAAFLLTTLARPAPGEPLQYGACALLPSLLPGQGPVDVRLFCPDDCPPADLARLARLAARHGLPAPLRRAELVRLLYRRCYRQRLPLVGYGLPAQLGRLAVGWRAGRAGGFSLIMAGRPIPAGRRRPAAERRRRPLLPNGQIENGDYARITVNVLDGQRTAIHLQGRGRPDPQDRAPDGEAGQPRDGYRLPGFFVDLATAATVQTGGARHPTARAAAQALRIPAGDHPPGDKPATDLEALLAELELIGALYLRLLECHWQTPGGDRVTLDQVYSAASYADAVLDAVGLELPLAHSDLPARAHAQGMGAFFGGDCGVAVRHQDVPVAYLDIAGHYPVSAHLMGAFDLLRATKLELVQEDPAELQQLLASLDAERLLADRALWRRLGRTVCLTRPVGQALPHRVPRGNTLLLKTAPLESSQPLPYMLADLGAAVLRGDQAPQIASAFSLRTLPRRRKRLHPLTLPSGRRFDPAHEDLFLVLAEERHRFGNDATLPAEERARQGKLLKLIVNAACFGLLCQFNVQPGGDVELTALDGAIRTVPADAVEEPGRRAMPIAAAGVTATGRLLLQLARTILEQAGTVCSWDTDSACAAATPHGGPVPCPGGPLRDANDNPAISAISYKAVEHVQQQLERLSPYAGAAAPQLLELEPENYDPSTGKRLELRLYATAAKNYDLYTITPGNPPTLTLVKWSEHGLGHLRTPGQPDLDNRDWIREGRLHLLNRELGLPSQEPDWWHEPSLSLITLNRPRELTRLQATLAASGDPTLLRPFSRLVVAPPDPLYARGPDGHRRTPIAPFHAGFNPHRAPWRDLTTGQPLAIRFRTSPHLTEGDLATLPGTERVVCTTIGAALERNHRRPEAKALDQNGNPCTRGTTGLLQPAPTESSRIDLIGRETRNLERAGITEDPIYTRYTDPEREAWRQIFLPSLRELAPGLIPPGRPSRHQRARLICEAGRLARAVLRSAGAGLSDEQACYLFLRAVDQRGCACGCGAVVSGRARYLDGAHRTRAYRQRLQGDVSARSTRQAVALLTGVAAS
jgi:hypothetical protein